MQMYGRIHGMQKATLYLPRDLKAKMVAIARIRGVSEAQVIREALRKMIDEEPKPQPRIPLITSGDPMLAERVNEALEGFGEV